MRLNWRVLTSCLLLSDVVDVEVVFHRDLRRVSHISVILAFLELLLCFEFTRFHGLLLSFLLRFDEQALCLLIVGLHGHFFGFFFLSTCILFAVFFAVVSRPKVEKV